MRDTRSPARRLLRSGTGSFLRLIWVTNGVRGNKGSEDEKKSWWAGVVVGSFYKDPLRPSLLIRRTERGARHENRANRPTDLLSLGAEVNIRPITLNATPAKRLNDAADLARAISGKIKLIINRIHRGILSASFYTQFATATVSGTLKCGSHLRRPDFALTRNIELKLGQFDFFVYRILQMSGT